LPLVRIPAGQIAERENGRPVAESQ
jgi:hypothetical protein